MLSQLSPEEVISINRSRIAPLKNRSMRGLVRFLAIRMRRAFVTGGLMGTTGGMMFVKLLGAVRTIEFMALAGNSHKQGNSHQKDRE